MQYDKLLAEEKRKLLNIVKHEFVSLDFSKMTDILDNNYSEPLWMDVSVLLYSLNIKNVDITIYDILLKKLSKPFARFYFKDGDKRYVATEQEFFIKQYVWYAITKEPISYSIDVQYIPQKDYIKQILKLDKFNNYGIYLKHVTEDKFSLSPINETFSNIDEAEIVYNRLIEIQDLNKSLKLEVKNFIENYEAAKTLAKDKRMIATLSNILSSFNIKFILKENYITVPNTDVSIATEDEATLFQARVIDAYHFFRNVINTEKKRDIVSEIYNKKVSNEIKEQFENGISEYLNIVKNREMIDWIVTISKESKYTLKINFDEQGVFYIDGAIIVTPQDAKEYYIDYMDKKKEKLAMAVYNNNIVNKIKRVWNIFKSKFSRISFGK